MTSRLVDVVQHSPEWLQARCGRLTSTGAKAVVTKGRKKGDESVTRRDLKLQLVCERLTGRPAEDAYQSSWMQRGTVREADARAAYEAQTGQLVETVGFLAVDEWPIGCSPDGLIAAGKGLIEIKCPKMATHLRYLDDGGVPAEYVPQILHALWVSQAEWCDFVSFEPNFPPSVQLMICRVQATEDVAMSTTESLSVERYAAAARAFLAEVDAEQERVRALIDTRAVA